MGKTKERKPFLVRTAKGKAYFVDTLEEALSQFSSKDGFRLTFEAGGKIMLIQRNVVPIAGALNGKTTKIYKADITIADSPL